MQCLLFLFSNKYYHQRPHSHFIVYGRDFGKSHCLQVLKFLQRFFASHRSYFMNCKNLPQIVTEMLLPRRLCCLLWWVAWDVPYWHCLVPLYSTGLERCYRQSALPPIVHDGPEHSVSAQAQRSALLSGGISQHPARVRKNVENVGFSMKK